jgi:hypothetical protein
MKVQKRVEVSLGKAKTRHRRIEDGCAGVRRKQGRSGSDRTERRSMVTIFYRPQA